MKLSCPKDDTHKVFNVSAWSAEIWTIDESGEIILIHPDDVVEREDNFKCDVCDTDAKVEQ